MTGGWVQGLSPRMSQGRFGYHIKDTGSSQHQSVLCFVSEREYVGLPQRKHVGFLYRKHMGFLQREYVGFLFG